MTLSLACRWRVETKSVSQLSFHWDFTMCILRFSPVSALSLFLLLSPPFLFLLPFFVHFTSTWFQQNELTKRTSWSSAMKELRCGPCFSFLLLRSFGKRIRPSFAISMQGLWSRKAPWKMLLHLRSRVSVSGKSHGCRSLPVSFVFVVFFLTNSFVMAAKNN